MRVVENGTEKTEKDQYKTLKIGEKETQINA